MKLPSFNPNKSTATLTLTLLTMMLGSGLVSAAVAYKMGHDALKGVSQPDANPAKKVGSNAKKSGNPQEFTPVDENKILAEVNNRINGSDKDEDAKDKNNDKDKEKDKDKDKQNSESAKKEQKANIEATLPLSVNDKGVTFEVVKTSQQGGSLLLDVNLSNKGSNSVQFLYSFLEVQDQQGRSISAMAEGLPGELPANGEKFSGKVKIPLELVDEGEPISLNLTDYPDQKLKLNIPNIPVK